MVGPASASTTRARTARGSTRRGVVEKFGVKPEQVVDVLALVGDTSDNVAGVPGIGKKGAIDLITQYGSLDALIARAGELKPKQREALQTHREDALRSRELVTIRTDVPSTSTSRRSATAAARASGATSCSHVSTSGRWWPSTRRRPTPSRRTTRSSTRSTALDALVAELERRGRVRVPDHSGSPLGHPREHRRHRVLHPRSAGALRAAGTRVGGAAARPAGRRRGDGADRPAAGARSPAPAVRGRADPQDRPRPQVRRHGAGPARRERPRPGVRLDARELSAGRDASGTSARGDVAGAPRLQGADRRGRVRPRRQGAAAAAHRAGGAAQLRRRARRPGAAARRAGWRRCSSPMASSPSTASSRCRWCRSWPTWSAPASASIAPALGAAVGASRTRARRLHRRGSSSSPARRSTSTRRSSSGASSSRSCS